MSTLSQLYVSLPSDYQESHVIPITVLSWIRTTLFGLVMALGP